jgi:hypothetical protein
LKICSTLMPTRRAAFRSWPTARIFRPRSVRWMNAQKAAVTTPEMTNA